VNPSGLPKTNIRVAAASQPTALSLFSGIGGLCEGVRLAGFNVTGAVELDRYAAANYRANFPGIEVYEGDVSNFLSVTDKKELKAQVSQFTPKSRLDLLFGGPPCQGYSQIGTRDISDPRNALYRQMLRIAEQTKPRAILIENVPNLLLMQGGLFKRRILNDLRDIGYDNVGLTLLNAADFGVPQERKRVFFLAVRSREIDFPMQDALNIAAESLKSRRVSVWEAIGDLPAKVAEAAGITLPYPRAKAPSAFLREMRLDLDGMVLSREDKVREYRVRFGKSLLHNHHTKEIQARRLALIKLLKPGLKADSLPKHVWDNARPEKWRRLHPEKPAYTLMAQMHRDLSEWVHPREHRWISVREAMRLMSFHDGIVLGGSEWQQLKQVGNAVPPLLGRIPALAAQYALCRADGLPSPFQEAGQQALFSYA
jgi:DNA (cytosine-5)-methyltransferase 1